MPRRGATTKRVSCLTDVDARGSLAGLKAKTLEEFEILYCRHARYLGFSIRKSTQRLCGGTNNKVKEKYFCCSCEGFSKPICKASVRKKKRNGFPFKRTGCKASIRLKLNNEGIYEVVHHIEEHNHPLFGESLDDFQRSESCITEEDEKATEGILESESDMETSDDFQHLGDDVHEFEGYEMNDHLKYLEKLSMKLTERRDLETLIAFLHENAAKDPGFFFKVKFDSMDKLCCVFWRDSLMKEDYQNYGDVTVFDTSCQKYKCSSVCASFVGKNNHRKNVMFGCAFLAHNNTESFAWVFDEFQKSMGGVSPVSFFTDESLAIADAVEEAFPQSKHRLCLWHLEDHAISHSQELNCDLSFRDDFNKCLKACVDEVDFQTCWASLISKYGLQKHPWFSLLYQLREKWCTALHSVPCSAKISSFQRIKDLKNIEGFEATQTTNLTQFFSIFKETIKQWRKLEEDDEFEGSRSAVKSALPMADLLEHASEVYTHTLFKDFEKEVHAAMGSEGKLAFVFGDSCVYKVFSKDLLGSQAQVTYTCVNNSVSVSCSCNTFEESGWLCYHCIKILGMNSVSRMPEQYLAPKIRRRNFETVWTRNLRDQTS